MSNEFGIRGIKIIITNMESDTKGHSRELPNMGLNEEGDKRVDTLFSFNSNANTPTMSSIVDYLKV